MSQSLENPVDIHKLKQTCASCTIQQLCLPAGIGKDDFTLLDGVVKRQRPLKKGDQLFRASEPFEKLYVVRSGTVKTFHQGGDGEDQIMGFHYPGDILGMDAIHADFHSCSAECLEHTSVCELPFAKLEEISARLPALRRQFMRIISREMINDHKHLLLMGKKNAHERLAIFLLSLSQRFKQRGFSATSFNLSMSRYDLANYLGLAVETVSRLFTRFQEQGILEVNRKSVEILDMDKLVEQAAANDSAKPEGSDVEAG